MTAPELHARARRFILRRENPVPAAMAALAGADGLGPAAASLLFDAATADPTGGAELRLTRYAAPDVLFTPATCAWRCPDAGVAGLGPFELVAWARDCDLITAAAWCWAVRRAAAACQPWQLAA